MTDSNEKKKKTASDVLSLVALLVALFSIALAVAFDIIAFKDVILQFIAALIIPCIAFVFLFIAMIASFIFIFGIVLVKEHGFWPLTLSIQFFKEILGDIKVSPEAIQLFRIFRIILLVLCVAIIVISIVSRAIAKSEAEINQQPIKKSVKGKTTPAIILAILGIIVSSGALAIVANL